MKKVFLMIGLALSVAASAQVLNVTSQQQLNLPTGDVKVAGIAQDGSYVLLTSGSNRGLQKVTVATGATEVLSEADGAGYNAEISANGQTILFREKMMQADRTILTTIKRADANGQKTEVQRPTRSARQLAVASNLQMARPTVSIEDRQLMLTFGATTTMLSPLGDKESYIWPSVSPDGKKVLFYVCGKGAFVSDITGKNVQFLGHDLRAPKWYNNSVVIGMNDKDNGEVTTSSEIVAVSLNGQKQVLTSGINAMYPYAANGYIVCSGFNGETYLLTIEK